MRYWAILLNMFTTNCLAFNSLETSFSMYVMRDVENKYDNVLATSSSGTYCKLFLKPHPSVEHTLVSLKTEAMQAGIIGIQSATGHT